MFKNLFSTPPNSGGETVEVNPNPRPGVFAPPPKLVEQWIEQDAEVIDLGSPQRDQAILPTTWHHSPG